MDDKVIDIILQSLEKANDKLDVLQQIPPTCRARGIELEKMVEEQARMNEVLDRNTASLEIHMKRTEMAEKAIQKLDGRLAPIEERWTESKTIRGFIKNSGMFILKVLSALAATIGLWRYVAPILLKFLS